jgi:hypothetical protein
VDGDLEPDDLARGIVGDAPVRRERVDDAHPPASLRAVLRDAQVGGLAQPSPTSTLSSTAPASIANVTSPVPCSTAFVTTSLVMSPARSAHSGPVAARAHSEATTRRAALGASSRSSISFTVLRRCPHHRG